MSYVSVIIPTYKDWPRLKLCLESLVKQTYPADQFEVIVVNNDPEETCPYELPAANMKIIAEAKPGSYAARNAGIEIAQGELLAFTDSDCIPDKYWLQNSIEVFQSNPSIERVAGRIAIFQTGKTSDALFIYQKYFTLGQEKYVLQKGTALTANFFAKSTVFNAVGLFRSDLYSGGDIEWGVRAYKKDIHILYAENVVINHPTRESVKELLKKKRRTTGGYYQLNYSQEKWINLTRYVLKTLIPPIFRMKEIQESLPFILSLKIVTILWLNRLTGALELINLIIFKSNRLRK